MQVQETYQSQLSKFGDARSIEGLSQLLVPFGFLDNIRVHQLMSASRQFKSLHMSASSCLRQRIAIEFVLCISAPLAEEQHGTWFWLVESGPQVELGLPSFVF